MLGKEVIKQLAAQQIKVKALVRNTARVSLSVFSDIEICEGDICDDTFMQRACNGCTHLVHCAALTAQHISDYAPFQYNNVTGTLNVVKAAIKNKLVRFIYVSTANTVGFGSYGNPGIESNPMCLPFLNAPYAKSKHEAEERLLKEFISQIEIVIVNPTFILGNSLSGSGEILKIGLHNKWVLVPPGGKNFVSVKKVAEATISALHKAKSGEKYLLCGENLTYQEFFKSLEKYRNTKASYLRLPKNFWLLAGYAGSLLQKTGAKTRINKVNMAILCCNTFYSNAKAGKELGINFTPVMNFFDELFRNNTSLLIKG